MGLTLQNTGKLHRRCGAPTCAILHCVLQDVPEDNAHSKEGESELSAKTYVIKRFHYLMLIPERSALSRRRGTIIAFIGLLCEPRSSLMYLRD